MNPAFYIFLFVLSILFRPLLAQEYDAKVESLLQLSQSYYNQKKHLESASLFKKIVDSLEFIDPLSSIRLCKDIGAFYHIKRNHYEALNYYFRGINLIKNPINTVSNTLFYIKFIDKSFDKGRGFKTEVARDEGLALYAQLYSRLGGVYFNRGNFSKAKEYWNLSLKISIANNFSKGMASAFNNIAEISRLENKPKDALFLYHKATKILRQLNDDFTLSLYYSNIALSYLELKQLDSAQYFLGLSEQLANKQDDPMLKMRSNFNMGEFFNHSNQSGKATFFYSKVIQHATQLQDKNFLNDSYQRLAELYQQDNKPDSALIYLNKWIALSEEIKAVEIEKLALETEAKYVNEEQKKELKYFKERSKIEQENAQLNKRVFYGFIVGLIFILVVVLFTLNWRNQHNQKLKQHLQQIKQKNKEKDVLLKEIHHRVKNNLQVITSLLGLQSSTIEDVEIKKVFHQSQSRIKSMALIHEMLYQAGSISEIEYKDYLNQLVQHIIDTNLQDKQTIDYYIDAPKFFLNIDTAIPLGLLINEIVTNSIKYAFVNKPKGMISICINQTAIGKFSMLIEDDGIGYDAQKIKASSINSLGLKLIYKLIKQLNGRIEKVDHAQGVRYQLEFEMIKEQ